MVFSLRILAMMVSQSNMKNESVDSFLNQLRFASALGEKVVFAIASHAWDRELLTQVCYFGPNSLATHSIYMCVCVYIYIYIWM